MDFDMTRTTAEGTRQQQRLINTRILELLTERAQASALHVFYAVFEVQT
jgi:hypothetical protein